MFRKLIVALATAAALGAVALAPTTASAWHAHGGWGGGGGGWHGGHFRTFFGGPRVVVAGPAYYNPCLRRVFVQTPFGPRPRVVNVCY